MTVLISEVWLELRKFLGSSVYTGRQYCTVRTGFHVVESTLLCACGTSLEEFKGLLDIVFFIKRGGAQIPPASGVLSGVSQPGFPSRPTLSFESS